MTEQAKSIIKWQYWLYNHGPAKQVLVEVFGEHLGNHFNSKFEYFADKYQHTALAWSKLFMEMSTGNQELLADWVCQNYHGVDGMLKGGEE